MSRPQLRAEGGLTLVETLVVVLIVGILAAIALPGLLGQRTRAQDSNATASAATAAKAAALLGTDRDGYDDVSPAELVKVERSLTTARNLQAEGAGRRFRVSVDSVSGTTYSVERAADGTLTRACAPAGAGSCRADGRW